jgi:hypothetical protein
MEASEGVEGGLAPKNPVSDKRSKQYFLWHKKIPLDECATSNPKKYFNLPKSLILKDE